jgi:hypothetical protein
MNRPTIEAIPDTIRIIFGVDDVIELPIERKPNGRLAISAEGGFYHEGDTIEELVALYWKGWEGECLE